MVYIFALLAASTRASPYLRRGVCGRSLLSVSMMSSNSEIPTLLPASKAVELHKNHLLKFIDGSWHMGKSRNPMDEFLSERIPDSQFFDLDEVSDKSTDLPHMLPSNEAFADAISSCGISNSDHVVVYVHPNCFSGPRLWWMFKAFGHTNVSILDGGLNAWKAAGGVTVVNEPVTPVAPGKFTAELVKTNLVDVDGVLRVVNTGSAQIVDARSKGRFEGTAPEPRAGLEGGHMPGSLNLPFTMLVQDDDFTKFRSPAEIRDAFKDAGVIFGSKIILTCGSGVSAAVLALGLNLLGQDLSSSPIYDGSWSEWGARSDLPKMK